MAAGSFLEVAFTSNPPVRLEGGGFKIKDILNDVPQAGADPFLMWHELPRTHHKKGSFPGAPRHPHRGFMECPYMREITAETGNATSKGSVWAGGKEHSQRVEPGSFELGKVGIGIEHEMVTDSDWSGILHGFQLWVNLPAANKFDAPHFQQAVPAALPVVALPGGATARIMHGSVGEKASPTRCDAVEWQYLDFEVPEGTEVLHDFPTAMTTRMAYVYRGECEIQGTKISMGNVAVLEGEGALKAKAGSAGCGFLFIAGKPIGEPIVSHGPFVMSNRDQIRQCFADYQQGTLCSKPLTLQQLS